MKNSCLVGVTEVGTSSRMKLLAGTSVYQGNVNNIFMVFLFHFFIKTSGWKKSIQCEIHMVCVVAISYMIWYQSSHYCPLREYYYCHFTYKSTSWEKLITCHILRPVKLQSRDSSFCFLLCTVSLKRFIIYLIYT